MSDENCRRCASQTQVLLQPFRENGQRTLCGKCVGKDARRNVSETTEACRAYKRGERGAIQILIRNLGKVEAENWMHAADEANRKTQKTGGAW